MRYDKLAFKDLPKLGKLPPRQFAAQVTRHIRGALKAGDCDTAMFLLHLGKLPKILSRPAWRTLRDRVEVCEVERKRK